MTIDKNKLRNGIWYEDADGNRIIAQENESCPAGAKYAHVVFPLEVRHSIYHIRRDEKGLGSYGDKDLIFEGSCHLCRASGRLAVAMVNSGDYELDEALAVLAQACERCVNVLWTKDETRC